MICCPCELRSACICEIGLCDGSQIYSASIDLNHRFFGKVLKLEDSVHQYDIIFALNFWEPK